MAEITIGYWDIRGLAQPIRLLLAYNGVKFEDKQYSAKKGDAPNTWDRSDWFNVKFTLGLPLANLPYLIDGDVKMTQTNAIFNHLGRKFNMLGDTAQQQANNDMMLLAIMDFRNAFVTLCYRTYPDEKDKYKEGLPKELQKFSEFLGKNEFFAGGEKPTVCDFHIYEMLDQHRLLYPGCLDKFANLREFCERFEALPTIAAYMKSDKFMKAPINNKMAFIGN